MRRHQRFNPWAKEAGTERCSAVKIRSARHIADLRVVITGESERATQIYRREGRAMHQRRGAHDGDARGEGLLSFPESREEEAE
ncbi:unnamed protein product [Urochloa humidicola]